MAKFDLTVVYVLGKDNTVADCLSRWAYPASKGMTDISAHGDEAETAEAKKIMHMEHIMEEEGVKCFVVMAADAPLGRRVRRAVRVLAPEGAESDKHLFPESCLQDDWTDDYAKSEAFESEYRALIDPDDGQKWPKGLTEEDGKLYRNGRLLVPESRVLELCVGMQVRIRTNSLEFEFAPNSHEFVEPSEFEFATSNSNFSRISLNRPDRENP